MASRVLKEVAPGAPRLLIRTAEGVATAAAEGSITEGCGGNRTHLERVHGDAQLLWVNTFVQVDATCKAAGGTTRAPHGYNAQARTIDTWQCTAALHHHPHETNEASRRYHTTQPRGAQYPVANSGTPLPPAGRCDTFRHFGSGLQRSTHP